jgi:hypothetical protein
MSVADGRWLQRFRNSGVLTMATADEAMAKAEILALRTCRAHRNWEAAYATTLNSLRMSQRVSAKPNVLVALLSIGWEKRQSGSHQILTRPGWPDFDAFIHEGTGPRMLARTSKHTGQPSDL